ncbi:uncharacterized protein THITE_117983 [Thermothielavioides terrestris NRRL 8126]|uniref:Uncharacterized protein n=1 Tax=Thermothielavioides terrestris (strain ATCC 38088 / NRRL 8126) TaxID=578455 RepID=G2R6M4_THETT|nr:uncharacterized protein THITE_117983 [Thermothielavioides terrestris NRRL 8126]AEO67656.1 hypothetical protein THITE_117983 [Thermothielavioides terrestris NRRL 8126]
MVEAIISKLFSSLGFRLINATPEERSTSEVESPADDAPTAPTERTSSAAATPTNDDKKEEKKEEDEDEEIEESEPPTPYKGSFGHKRRASSDLDSTPKKRVPTGVAHIILYRHCIAKFFDSGSGSRYIEFYSFIEAFDKRDHPTTDKKGVVDTLTVAREAISGTPVAPTAYSENFLEQWGEVQKAEGVLKRRLRRFVDAPTPLLPPPPPPSTTLEEVVERLAKLEEQ